LAADPDLEAKVTASYAGKECLPALLATFRCYRAQVARDDVAAAAAAGVVRASEEGVAAEACCADSSE